MPKIVFDTSSDLQLIAGRGAFLRNSGVTSHNPEMEHIVLRNVSVGPRVLRMLSDLAEVAETEHELTAIVRDNLEAQGRAKDLRIFFAY